LEYSIQNFDNDNKIHLQNTLTENEFVNNYKNIGIDVLVLNYNKKFLTRIRNESINLIIICNEYLEIERCIDIFEKSKPANYQIILTPKMTSTEVIMNLTNILNNEN